MNYARAALLFLTFAPAAAQESAPKLAIFKLDYAASSGPVVSAAAGELAIRDFQLSGAPLRWPADVAYEDLPRESSRPAPGRRVLATALDASGKALGIAVAAHANLLDAELKGLEPGAPYFLRARLDCGAATLRLHSNVITSSPPPIVMTALGDPDVDCDLALDLAHDRLCRAMPSGTAVLGHAEPDGTRWIEWRGVASPTGTAGRLQLELYPEALRRRLNLPPGSIHARRFDRPASGWRSWHAYGAKISEASLRDEAAQIRAKLAPFGLDVFQIDDGWQSAAPGASLARAWTPAPDRFPRGLAPFAASLKEAGLRPGIWWVPQAAAVEDRATKGLLRDDAGAPIDGGSIGPLVWNAADADGLARIGESAAALVRDGFEHFSIDAQPQVLAEYRDAEADESSHVGASTAYRASVDAVRRAIGPARFLASGGGADPQIGPRTPVDAAGLVDSLRTAGDVEATRRGLLLAADAVATGTVANGLAWWADPNVVLVGGTLTIDEARAWASLVSLSGQSLFASERIGDLPEARLDVLRRVLPTLPIREMRWDERVERPRLVRVWKEKDGETSLVSGHFAYDHREGTFAPVGDRQLSLAMRGAEKFEFWSGRFLGRAPIETAELPLFVEPGSCAVVASRAPKAEPFVLSTSRHVTQGWPDLSRERFDAATSTLSGASDVVGGDPYELRVVAPSREWKAASAEAGGLACALESEGRLTRVRFTSPVSKNVAWSVRFAKVASPPPASKPAQVARLHAEVGGEPSVRVSWSEPQHSTGAFLVRRRGAPLATTLGLAFVDYDVKFNQEYDYEITPIDDEAKPGAPATIKVVSRQPSRVKLSGLEHFLGPSPGQACRVDAAASGGPLTIGGQVFGTGFGVQAPATVAIPLHGLRGRLTALFGIDDGAGGKGSASLRVMLDGHELAKSPVMRGGQKPFEVRADIYEGVTLTLEFGDGGDGMEWDFADFASATIRPFRG